MKVPQNSGRSTGARRAWAQPRFLLGAAALTLAGATLASFAAPSATTTKAPVAMPHTASKEKIASLADLPAMVARYGEARRLSSATTSTGGRTTSAIGTGQSGFNLVETDLTPNSPSDEREPVTSPGGDFIAFTSTGADTNGDGQLDSLSNGSYRHIWIMNRDGSGARQLTGLNGNVDVARNQTHPTWSPDGNQIAYSDEDTNDNNSEPGQLGSQLYVVDALDTSPVPSQRTFFQEENGVPAQVQSPAWAPSGLSIAFVTNYDGRQSATDGNRILPTRDIFSIAPDGTTNSLTRLTGDSGDPGGDLSDDDHPAWASRNTNLLLFSSNRDANGLLTGLNAGGRRIWRIFSDGTGPNPVTDPLQRTNGQGSDVDDYPVVSTAGGSFTGAGGATKTVGETLAFQTNTFLDDTDQADGAQGRDLNVWSLSLNTNNYTATESRVFVSSYDDNKVTGVNTTTLQPSATVPRLPTNGGDLNSPEGIAIEQDSSGTEYVYVSDRGRGQVDRFIEASGASAGGVFATNPQAFAFTPATVPNPTAIKVYGGYIYVASGYNPATGAANTNAIYRFDQDTGAAAGNDATGLFSSGETAANGGSITNGTEGLAIDSTGRFIATSELLDNKINLYDRNSGNYLFSAADNASLVPANGGGLSKPTGLAWGPDLNSDGFGDLYVCSSANDAIKVYAGPNPAAANVFSNVGSPASDRPGTLIATLVADPNNGTGNGSTGLNAPEDIKIEDIAKHGVTGSDTVGSDGISEIYVTSFRTLGLNDNGTSGGGFQVNRYELNSNGTSSTALPWPANAPTPSPKPAAGDPQVNAAWISLPRDPANPTASGTLVGAGGFDFNFSALNQGAVTTSADETASNVSIVLTNILSSPKNFSDSRLTAPQTVDRAADGQPAFSRTVATAQTLARLVFVSGRKYEPSTASNGSTTPSNPYGGDGTYLLDSKTPIPNITHDIWTTSTKDTTPPALIPQGAGNLQYPVVAPQPNAPYFAPRTAEAGLKANITPTAADNASEAARAAFTNKGGLRFAVVLRDVESGIRETTTDNPTTLANAGVTISFYNADSPNYVRSRHRVDPSIDARISQEQKASLVSINNGGTVQSSFPLNVYDDGPGNGSSGGGHEQQAGAVAGDGIYYCEGLVPTPAAAGDFYIDLSVNDRQNNAFTYDNIWGISTRRFTRISSVSNLFVSDYTAGQRFPLKLASAFDDPRFANMPPVESYYLTNPPGDAFGSTDPANALYNTVVASSQPQTFSNVDIWRVLCRGPVTQDILNAYRPTIVKQIDPNVPYPTPLPTSTPMPGATATPIPTAGPTATPTSTPQPYTQLTRPVAVAKTAVIWAAPYAGTTFVGPGTITDSTTQASLTSYLQDGGRLFISGRDIARALTLTTGTSNNTFLANELAATFNGEASTPTIGAGPADFYVGTTLELPWNPPPPASNPDYYDAAPPVDGVQYGPGSYMYDIIGSSGAAGADVTVAYNQGGTVGQRVENTRSNGIRSRLVFFSFGFEGINRKFVLNSSGNPAVAVNLRANIAANILEYFRTSAVSGTVTTSGGGSVAAGSRVPNFLLRIDGQGGPYFVRTDANGNYSVSGLSNGTYTVRPFTQTINGVVTTLPEGYFGGTARTFFVGGGGTTTGVNLTVTPAIQGGIIGKAVTSNGTFTNRADDTPIPNLPVLVRSVGDTTPYTNGKFAKLGATNATGDFSISGVPALAQMEVIFNPNLSDIPAGSGITYAGPNTNYGRRILPDGKRPLNAIIVPSGDNFILNDTGSVTISGTTYTVDASHPDTAADERVPVLVPVGPTISGVITVNGTPVPGATVQLFPEASATPVPNPVQTSGSGGTTGADGAYSFVDVPAKTQANGGTNYTIRATITRDSATLVRSVTVNLVQGQDLTQNIDFTLATLTGLVRQGANPVANANVVLQNQDGTVFTVNGTVGRTAKTNAQGMYTLNNVPVGGYTYDPNAKVFNFTSANGNKVYNVVASLGTLTGASGNFSVSSTATNVTVPTIQLTNQQLSGTVFVRNVTANGNYTVPFPGATVELLNSAGASLSPQRTTTTGADGTYGFAGVTPGSYRIRATGKGDTVISGVFTATAGASPGPDVTLVLHVIFGGVVNTSNQAVSGATVTLSQNGTTIETLISRADGSFQFAAVAAGSGYLVTAVKGTSSGSKAVPTITRGVAPAPVVVPIKFTPVVTTKPTSFLKGHTYAVSFPYETSANATSRNIYDRTRGDATIALTDAFNYDPSGVKAGKATQFYTVSRFNPNTLAYEVIPDNGVLIRGEGYLLKVNDVPDNNEVLRLAMPADNAALKALTAGGASTNQRFLISLVYNSSLAGNGLNGRNFIGFPFDPEQFSSVAWDTTSTGTAAASTASVQVQYGGQNYTIKDAVTAGIIYPTLTDGTTGGAANAISAYGGYFVTSRKEGVKLLLQFPTPNS